MDFWAADNWSTGTSFISLVNGSLLLTETWTNPDEIALHTTAFPVIKDLTGATLSFDIYIAEEYITNGKLAMQLYLTDDAGHSAFGGWIESGWGPWRWSGSEISSTNTDSANGNHYGWVTVQYTISTQHSGIGVVGINNGAESWGYNPGIDVARITNVGLNIKSNGKPANVTGDIKIDNVILP